MTGYNKGDTYEGLVFDLLTARGLIAPNSNRGGAGSQADINFLYKDREINLEVKLDLNADYGQKMLKWSNEIWSWCVDDLVTEFYTQCGVLQLIQDKQIVPNRYSIPKQEITLEQKSIE
jgi:hypothetical protein